MPSLAQSVVDEQAEDDNLWFRPVYITEDYLQQALRRLHEAVERDTRKTTGRTSPRLKANPIRETQDAR